MQAELLAVRDLLFVQVEFVDRVVQFLLIDPVHPHIEISLLAVFLVAYAAVVSSRVVTSMHHLATTAHVMSLSDVDAQIQPFLVLPIVALIDRRNSLVGLLWCLCVVPNALHYTTLVRDDMSPFNGALGRGNVVPALVALNAELGGQHLVQRY